MLGLETVMGWVGYPKGCIAALAQLIADVQASASIWMVCNMIKGTLTRKNLGQILGLKYEPTTCVKFLFVLLKVIIFETLMFTKSVDFLSLHQPPTPTPQL
jgi:lysophospholipid acyltransferase (LPLAT)-like uncharacterized protein